MVVKLIDDKLRLEYFLYEIVHHCNLNCKGCDHCSPIAEEEFVDIQQFKNDLNALTKHFSTINSFAIMGGEPLLHPKLIDIIKISRKILKNTSIVIFTNGINLEKLPEKFWKTFKKENIVIVITKYKINLNYKKIYELKTKYDVKVAFENIKGKEFFHKIKFNLEGTENEFKSHKICYHGEVCHTLENGILYKCPIVSASRHFNKYFYKNMITSEKDGLNIKKKLKKEDIIEYFKNPIPFCRYCNMDDREENKEWGISKKEITEWT